MSASTDDAPENAYPVSLKAGGVHLSWIPQDARAYIKLWPSDPSKDKTLLSTDTPWAWDYTAPKDEILYFAVFQGGSGILVTTVDPATPPGLDGIITTTATCQGWAVLTFTNRPGTNTPVSRTLQRVQLEFQLPAGNDDYGKDHNTQMDVELYDKNGNQTASYREWNVWTAGSVVPSVGANFPQGYAPNEQVVLDMKVLANTSEDDLLNGGTLLIIWRPQNRDKWAVQIRLIITWNTGETTTTKFVWYTLPNSGGNLSLPILA